MGLVRVTCGTCYSCCGRIWSSLVHCATRREILISRRGNEPHGDPGAVITRLSVLVTNDTGPAHIAYTLGTPTVTIFGGGSPERNGPPKSKLHQVLAFEVPCRPCDYAACPIEYRCLAGVTVQQTIDAASAVMR